MFRLIQSISGQARIVALLALVSWCKVYAQVDPFGLTNLPPQASSEWREDISVACLDPGSDRFINFIATVDPDTPGPGFPLRPGAWGNYENDWRNPHPNLGVVPYTYGQAPIIHVTDDTSIYPLRQVTFGLPEESDGVGVPYYPIPDAAINGNYYLQGGYRATQPTTPGRAGCPPGCEVPNCTPACFGYLEDRHLLIYDSVKNFLYELGVVYNDTGTSDGWHAGAGAKFDLNQRPPFPQYAIRPGRDPLFDPATGPTSADSSGYMMSPGLIFYDEVYNQDTPIDHGFRLGLRMTNGQHVWPASHGSTADNRNALPDGARLRLIPGPNDPLGFPARPNRLGNSAPDITCYPADIQRVLIALRRYGLMLVDRQSPMGDEMLMDGAYDSRWNELGVGAPPEFPTRPGTGNGRHFAEYLRVGFTAPTFNCPSRINSRIDSNDFEVIKLGYHGPSSCP